MNQLVFDIETTLDALSLEEKASLCSGQDFWTTKAIPRLGIESLMLTDGPHGLRKQSSSLEKASLNESVPATCFPSGAGLAASWNRQLLLEVGRALGDESMAERVGVILGPAINIKRSPLCGRNFEYFSEDPFLAGQLAIQHIRGIQERGVGSSLKHFAVNNQEKNRMVIDAVVDERTIREIYLPAFEMAVRQAQPWTVMCAYNRLNGKYCSQNPELLTGILRDEWDFDGLVMTDWGACDDRVAGLRAGQDLEMPGNGGSGDRAIVAAVQDGTLPIAVLDQAVRRFLLMYQRIMTSRRAGTTIDVAGHHSLARRVAAESMVLLKNDHKLLPLAHSGKIAFIGEFARSPRYQGGGSSHMHPTQLDSALSYAREELQGQAEISFAPGYDPKLAAPDTALLAEAGQVAAAADIAVVFIGLTDSFESEGFDRSHLEIPASHLALLEAVLAVQTKVVVVLSNGSPISMPWLGRVDAVLESYLGGQGGAAAVVDILWGTVNPSGKLAETFPARLQDNPSFLNFPGDKLRVEYREGIHVGYRHYDALDIEPLFPFGHGLSYTSFAYGPLQLDKTSLRDKESLKVSLMITNSGKLAGQEVVQLYVSNPKSSVKRPIRELKGFDKVALAPKESKTLYFNLDRRAFAFWDIVSHDWLVESGVFGIAAGASSRDLRSFAEVTMTAPVARSPITTNSLFGDLLEIPATSQWARNFKAGMVAQFGNYETGSAEAVMMDTMVLEMPLRNIVRMSSGHFSEAELAKVLTLANGD